MESINQRNGNLPHSQYQQLRRYDINQPISPQLLDVSEPVSGAEDELFSNSSNSDDYSARSCSSCSGSSSRYLASIQVVNSPKLFLLITIIRSYILEWETHIDNNGELYYVEFSSKQQLAAKKDAITEKVFTNKEREKILKKKKKS